MFFLLVESVQWPTRPSRAFRRNRRASRRCPIAPLTGSRRAKQPVRLPGSCFCYSSTHERRHDYHPPGKAEKAGERKGRAGACGLRPRPGGGNNSQASRGESAASRIPPRGFVAARAGVHGKIMCRKTGGRGDGRNGGWNAERRGSAERVDGARDGEGKQESEGKAGGRKGTRDGGGKAERAKGTRDGGWSAERADGLRPVDGSGAACACGPADRADFRPCRTVVNEEGLPEPILPESAEVGLSTRARFFFFRRISTSGGPGDVGIPAEEGRNSLPASSAAVAHVSRPQIVPGQRGRAQKKARLTGFRGVLRWLFLRRQFLPGCVCADGIRKWPA